MKRLFLLVAVLLSLATRAQQTPYELSHQQETTTYAQAISFYQSLAKTYPKQARLFTYGSTDFGKPLHLLVLSKSGNFDPVALKKADQRIFLINNGIHPGEPEGIDASMMLARDLLNKTKFPTMWSFVLFPFTILTGATIAALPLGLTRTDHCFMVFEETAKITILTGTLSKRILKILRHFNTSLIFGSQRFSWIHIRAMAQIISTR